jgi:hypothetical protein
LGIQVLEVKNFILVRNEITENYLRKQIHVLDSLRFLAKV